MRSTIRPFADQLWREKVARTTGPFETNASAERIYVEIQALSPQTDLQRSLQARAAQISTRMWRKTRLLLFVESDNLIPAPFLAILVLWLVIIFASDGLSVPVPLCSVGVMRDFSDFGT
jgi:hypothetical protein